MSYGLVSYKKDCIIIHTLGYISAINRATVTVKMLIIFVTTTTGTWLLGFAISYGNMSGKGFTGYGFFALTGKDMTKRVYNQFLLHLVQITSVTTIISTVMTGNVNLKAFIFYSFTNGMVYSFPIHWLHHAKGFLRELGAFDGAFCGSMHFVSAMAAAISARIIGSR